MKKASIYTITKGNYKFGVIALINSLRSLGIDNEVIVGSDEAIIELNNQSNVTQVLIDSTWNPTNLKCKMIVDHPSDIFIFFDADIIVNDKKFMDKIEEFTNQGFFCAAVDGIVPQNDYRRYSWKKINPSENNSITEHPWYYNAGFFAGNMANHRSLLTKWVELISTNLNPTQFTFDNEDFPMADQDMYNATLQNYKLDEIVSFSMPDWIGVATEFNPFFQIANFRPYAFVHCTGEHKPWKIKGVPRYAPSEYDVKWYKFIFDPSNAVKASFPFSKLQHDWFKFSLRTRLIGKLKRRFKL